MKFLLLFIVPFFTNAYAQDVTFKELKLKPDSSVYNTKEATIVFPIVMTKNVKIDKLINSKLKARVFNLDNDSQRLKEVLKENITEYNLTNLSYEVTYKSNKILSMNIFAEGCGAHCSSWRTYFNFDLNTGLEITIDDLIAQNKIDTFKAMVFSDKIKCLTNYKIEEKATYLSGTDIDSVTYGWAIKQVDDECIGKVSIEDFILSREYLEIIDPCEFPFAIRSQEPAIELKYAYKNLLGFLNPGFKDKFLKPGH